MAYMFYASFLFMEQDDCAEIAGYEKSDAIAYAEEAIHHIIKLMINREHLRNMHEESRRLGNRILLQEPIACLSALLGGIRTLVAAVMIARVMHVASVLGEKMDRYDEEQSIAGLIDQCREVIVQCLQENNHVKELCLSYGIKVVPKNDGRTSIIFDPLELDAIAYVRERLGKHSAQDSVYDVDG